MTDIYNKEKIERVCIALRIPKEDLDYLKKNNINRTKLFMWAVKEVKKDDKN